MANTKIDWTEKTWNPVTGCTKISPGCKNCYAERMSKRLRLMGQPRYVDGFAVRCHEDTLGIPARWKKPSMIFVNSMGDLLHYDVPNSFVNRVLLAMEALKQHTYQVLTKRSDRMSSFEWPTNAWAGVSVESSNYKWRIDDLRLCDARIKFISFEPLLSDVGELDLTGIHWVIVGCESGPKRRPMDLDWVRSIRDQCERDGVALFFKQCDVGGKVTHKPMLDGRQHLSYPE